MRIGKAAAAAGVTPETLDLTPLHMAATLSRRNLSHPDLAEAARAACGPAQICSFP